MNLALTIILSILIIFLFFLLIQLKNLIKGFVLLIDKFVEVNQEFYEGQKNISKKDKEVLEGIMKQTTELSILRKYLTQMGLTIKNINEIIKNLRESQKDIKTSTEKLEVSKSIASSLAIVSNNIKLLDKVVMELKNSIEKIKKEKS